MKITSRGGGVIAGLTAVLAVGGTAAAFAATGSASPAPAVTAVTRVTNAPDSGGNGTWSFDDYTRGLVIRVNPAATGVPEGDTAYTATVTDSGQFNAITGAYAPNQGGADAGVKVHSAVKGSMEGTASYAFDAPAADVPSAANVVHSLNDDYTAATGANSTGEWFLQAFTGAQQAAVADASPLGIQGNWSWTYKTACESWTDSAATSDGQSAAAGNVTGRACPVPVLYGGSAQYVAATREKVGFKQRNVPTWDEFTIVGPGFNGQHGWVNAQVGSNTAYYEGLKAGHGYTVLYQPVTAQGSSTAYPGSHEGYVFFVSNQPATAAAA